MVSQPGAQAGGGSPSGGQDTQKVEGRTAASGCAPDHESVRVTEVYCRCGRGNDGKAEFNKDSLIYFTIGQLYNFKEKNMPALTT